MKEQIEISGNSAKLAFIKSNSNFQNKKGRYKFSSNIICKEKVVNVRIYEFQDLKITARRTVPL